MSAKVHKKYTISSTRYRNIVDRMCVYIIVCTYIFVCVSVYVYVSVCVFLLLRFGEIK